MDIKRLTITSVQKPMKNIVINNPTTESAKLLILDCFEMKSAYNVKTPKPRVKLPTWLKGFVDMRTLIR